MRPSTAAAPSSGGKKPLFRFDLVDERELNLGPAGAGKPDEGGTRTEGATEKKIPVETEETAKALKVPSLALNALVKEGFKIEKPTWFQETRPETEKEKRSALADLQERMSTITKPSTARAKTAATGSVVGRMDGEAQTARARTASEEEKLESRGQSEMVMLLKENNTLRNQIQKMKDERSAVERSMKTALEIAETTVAKLRLEHDTLREGNSAKAVQLDKAMSVYYGLKMDSTWLKEQPYFVAEATVYKTEVKRLTEEGTREARYTKTLKLMKERLMAWHDDMRRKHDTLKERYSRVIDRLQAAEDNWHEIEKKRQNAVSDFVRLKNFLKVRQQQNEQRKYTIYMGLKKIEESYISDIARSERAQAFKEEIDNIEKKSMIAQMSATAMLRRDEDEDEIAAKAAVYENAFRKIKTVTGTTEPNQIISKYLCRNLKEDNLANSFMDASRRLADRNREFKTLTEELQEVSLMGFGVDDEEKDSINTMTVKLHESSEKLVRMKETDNQVQTQLAVVKELLKMVHRKVQSIRIPENAVEQKVDRIKDEHIPEILEVIEQRNLAALSVLESEESFVAHIEKIRAEDERRQQEEEQAARDARRKNLASLKMKSTYMRGKKQMSSSSKLAHQVLTGVDPTKLGDQTSTDTSIGERDISETSLTKSAPGSPKSPARSHGINDIPDIPDGQVVPDTLPGMKRIEGEGSRVTVAHPRFSVVMDTSNDNMRLQSEQLAREPQVPTASFNSFADAPDSDSSTEETEEGEDGRSSPITRDDVKIAAKVLSSKYKFRRGRRYSIASMERSGNFHPNQMKAVLKTQKPKPRFSSRETSQGTHEGIPNLKRRSSMKGNELVERHLPTSTSASRQMSSGSTRKLPQI